MKKIESLQMVGELCSDRAWRLVAGPLLRSVTDAELHFRSNRDGTSFEKNFRPAPSRR